MPPRKMMPQKGSDLASSRGNTKLGSSRNLKGKNLHESKDNLQEPEEPEIDIKAAIEEMIAESNAKIAAALQARQENLVQIISQTDVAVSSPVKGTRK